MLPHASHCVCLSGLCTAQIHMYHLFKPEVCLLQAQANFFRTVVLTLCTKGGGYRIDWTVNLIALAGEL